MAIIEQGKIKVLIDTSAWISYFKKEKKVHSRIERLIEKEKVVITPFIVAELIQGAKGKKEIELLKELLTVFPVLQDRKETWLHAGLLSYHLRKKGREVGLSDCYIATIAKENGVSLYTLDRHFRIINKEFPFKLLSD
ncbi:MAG TPA: PIN domain nuclease [Candidatus Omnitrophica bacterium]|nr:PIN domain nuclease [Candidatus Omnitrophota bacterium]